MSKRLDLDKPKEIEQNAQTIQRLKDKVEALLKERDQLKAKMQEAPDSPVLLRWHQPEPSEGVNLSRKLKEKLIKKSEVSDEIQELIEIGAKAEDIEVWSRKRQPKVKIELG